MRGTLHGGGLTGHFYKSNTTVSEETIMTLRFGVVGLLVHQSLSHGLDDIEPP